MSQLDEKTERCLVGIDVGGTNVDGFLTDHKFQVLADVSFPIRGTAGEKPLDVIKNAVEELFVRAQVSPQQCGAIGVGVPGRVDVIKGTVDLAVNLETNAFPLADFLGDAFGVPVAIENDANAVALGYYHFKTGPEIRNLAFLTIGTGIGSGLVLNGEIFRGSHGMAGEVGHVVIEDSPYRCQCGNYGCLEVFAAGPGIARFGREAVAAGRPTILSQVPEITARAVFEEAQAGDEAGLSIVNKVGHYLGRGLQMMLMTIDVDRVVIGGGVSRAGNLLRDAILAEWRTMADRSEMARSMLRPEVLEMVDPHYQAGAWGAVAVARYGVHTTKAAPV